MVEVVVVVVFSVVLSFELGLLDASVVSTRSFDLEEDRDRSASLSRSRTRDEYGRSCLSESCDLPRESRSEDLSGLRSFPRSRARSLFRSLSRS